MKVRFFLLGIISGILLIAIFFVSGLVFYKLGLRLLEMPTSTQQHKNTQQSRAIASNFYLSFESNEDLKIFEARQSNIRISKEFATDGKHSLLVEFPEGSDYPSLFFEIMGKDCLNWANMKAFSFDVFNNIETPAKLTVKIKSGEQYPKRTFEKEFTLPSRQPTTIVIKREELKNKVDLNKISYLNLFMHGHIKTFRIYFDTMRVIKND